MEPLNLVLNCHGLVPQLQNDPVRVGWHVQAELGDEIGSGTGLVVLPAGVSRGYDSAQLYAIAEGLAWVAGISWTQVGLIVVRTDSDSTAMFASGERPVGRNSSLVKPITRVRWVANSFARMGVPVNFVGVRTEDNLRARSLARSDWWPV